MEETKRLERQINTAMKSEQFMKEAKAKTIDSAFLHGNIERELDGEYGIEDWRDQARAIMRYIKEEGGTPVTAKPPAGFTIDGQRAYLYRVKFIDLDGKEKWLAFEGEFGIAEITKKEPNPASFS